MAKQRRVVQRNIWDSGRVRAMTYRSGTGSEVMSIGQGQCREGVDGQLQNHGRDTTSPRTGQGQSLAGPGQSRALQGIIE